MASDRRPRRFVGALAAIVAAIEGAILLTQRTAQAAPNAVVSFTQEVMNLLTAMAQGIGSIIEKLDEVIDAIRGIPPGGAPGGGPSFPPNTVSVETLFVGCPFAQPKTFRLPSIVVPEGMLLQIKGAPGNWGIVYVANAEVKAGQPAQAWPLLPNEAVGYQVKNANALWIGAVLAPPIIPTQDGVYITVEQA